MHTTRARIARIARLAAASAVVVSLSAAAAGPAVAQVGGDTPSGPRRAALTNVKPSPFFTLFAPDAACFAVTYNSGGC